MPSWFAWYVHPCPWTYGPQVLVYVSGKSLNPMIQLLHTKLKLYIIFLGIQQYSNKLLKDTYLCKAKIFIKNQTPCIWKHKHSTVDWSLFWNVLWMCIWIYYIKYEKLHYLSNREAPTVPLYCNITTNCGLKCLKNSPVIWDIRKWLLKYQYTVL